MAVSNRQVSKGSSRGAGPQKRKGAVHVREFSPIDWSKEPPRCPCGGAKEKCGSCGDWYCAAPGHLKHACGGAP
jgi:hypothetical protein